MKVCLVFPNIKESRVVFYSSVHQPAGLAYLAAVLERAGIDVIIIDMTAERIDFHALQKKISAFTPDIVGITTNVAIAKQACLTGKFVKKYFPQVQVIFGGPWATVNAEYIITRGIGDVVVVGEGEDTFLELCHHIQEGKPLNDVKGIGFKAASGAVIKTGARPFIENLDAIPFPAWYLFPPSKHYMHFNRYFPYFPVLTTRGCIYDCIHCTKFVHGYKIRYRSVENVLDELVLLKKKHGAKEVFIIDDNFTMSRAYCTGVLKGIIKRGIDLKINFSNGIRADTVTPGLVKLLKRAGTYSIALGVESGNDTILKHIGKHTNTGAIRYAASLIKKENMVLRTFFILGLPGDTDKTMSETIQFARELDADYAHFFMANVFPGTKMHDMLKEDTNLPRHMFSNFYNKMDKDTYQGFVPWKSLHWYHKRAYLSYYARPLKLLSIISKFKTFQELKWMINFIVLLVFDFFKR